MLIRLCLATALTFAGAMLAQAPLPRAPKATVVDISGSGGRATEPGIALNPKNPAQVVAVYQGGAEVQGLGAAAYSTDAGRTFALAKGTALTDWHVVGDVTATFDNQGHAFWCYLVFDRLGTTSYWAHTVSRKGIFVRRSNDGGKTWAKGVPVRVFPTGHESAIQFEDEPRIFADTGPRSRFAGTLYVGWVEWQIDKSIMLFSRSIDAGQTWSTPIRVDTHPGLPRDDNGALGGFMQSFAADGTLYAIWSDGNSIVFTESHDAGKTFSHPRPIIETAPPYFEVTGVFRTNGFPQIACYDRRLYVTWSDYRNGDVDVFLASSADRGRTWSAALRVNDDPVHNGIDQFFQSMTVDPVTGFIYAVFYDRRRDPDNQKLTLTLARSTDAGSSFRNYAWTDSPWQGQNAFLGDYTWIAALNNRVYAAWTETVPRVNRPTGRRADARLLSFKTKVRVGAADFSGGSASSFKPGQME
jgi:hypothetical protein